MIKRSYILVRSDLSVIVSCDSHRATRQSLIGRRSTEEASECSSTSSERNTTVHKVFISPQSAADFSVRYRHL